MCYLIGWKVSKLRRPTLFSTKSPKNYPPYCIYVIKVLLESVNIILPYLNCKPQYFIKIDYVPLAREEKNNNVVL